MSVSLCDVCGRIYGFIRLDGLTLLRTPRYLFTLPHVLEAHSGSLGVHCYLETPQVISTNFQFITYLIFAIKGIVQIALKSAFTFLALRDL